MRRLLRSCDATRGQRIAAACVAVVVSACLGVARFWGYRLDVYARPPFKAVSPGAVVAALLWTVVGLVGTYLLLLWLPSREAPRPTPSGRRRGARWMATMLLLLLAWLPYYLLYYPGILIRDSWSSLFQGTHRWPLTNHHPVLFTKMVGGFQGLAETMGLSPTAGVAMFSAFQAVLSAAGLSLVVLWVRRRGGRWAGLAATAYLALDPSVAMWSITMTKDVLFAVAMTLLTCCLAEVGIEGLERLTRPGPLAALVACLLAVSFTRNNGPLIVALIALTLTLMALWRMRSPGCRLRWLVVPAALGLAVVGTVQVQGAGYRHAHVAPPSFAESIGVPLVQVAYVNSYGTLSEQDAAVVSKMMPLDRMRQVYAPYISDPIKLDPLFRKEWLADHRGEFIGTWRHVCRTDPGSCFKGWYALAGGYLDPARSLSHFDAGTKRGSFGLEIRDQNLLTHDPGAPERVASSFQRTFNLPVLRWLYLIPLLFWTCLVALLSGVGRGRLEPVLVFLPFYLLVGTLVIASPILDFRYVGAAHTSLPVLLVALWRGTGARRQHGDPGHDAR